MFAYFNNVPELGRAMKYGNSPPVVPAPTREQQARLDELNQRARAFEELLRHNKAASTKHRASGKANPRSRSAEYLLVPASGLDAEISFEDEKLFPLPGRIEWPVCSMARPTWMRVTSQPSTSTTAIRFSTCIYSDTVPDGSVLSDGGQTPRQGLRRPSE